MQSSDLETYVLIQFWIKSMSEFTNQICLRDMQSSDLETYVLIQFW